MGNFSRNTFDPLKNYVAVRLQQGVPVLDADWNELNDVTRQELYDTFSLTFTDGVQPHSFDLEVGFRQEPNDFSVLAGAALIQGRPVRVRNNLRYSTQLWTDPNRAARDGVAVIPPLTTPTGSATTPPRTDIVYLDIWEREVGSAEDVNLINPAIGVETSVRLKREAAVRVAEGTTTLPPAPAGHAFLPLALLRRPVNQAQITNIESIRPFFYSPQGTGVVSFFPAFLPVHSVPSGSPTRLPEWRIAFSSLAPAEGQSPKFRAVKADAEAATGVLPLILPDGARLSSFGIRGDISTINGQLQWQLLRIGHQAPGALEIAGLVEVLAEDTIRALSSGRNIFSTTYGLSTTDPKLIVDNSRFYYALLASTFSFLIYGATIHGLSIGYKYFGLAGEPTHDHD
jgi:hypothetical protein